MHLIELCLVKNFVDILHDYLPLNLQLFTSQFSLIYMSINEYKEKIVQQNPIS